MALTKTLAIALGLLALLLTWRLGDGGLFLLLAMAAAMAAGEYFYRFAADRFPLPCLGLVLSPLLLINYSSVGDFRIRLACFFMLTAIFFLAPRFPRRRVHFSLTKASPWQIWIISFLVFALAAIVFHVQGIHLSGDEPHYVMIAQSLVEDGDFDLKNNLENKTYFAYLPVEIRFHGLIHAGRYRSFHLPGISFLMVPGFFLFKLFNGAIPAALFFRLCAAFINAFFALGLFLAFKTFLPDHNHGKLFIFFLTTFPLVFHAVHLYPELPAATLMIYAYLFSRGRYRFFFPGLLLALIPWLHLKYVLPVALLALAVSAGIWRQGGARIKRLASFFAAPILSLSLLVFYSKTLYGFFYPGSISPEKNFFAIPLALKMETLFSFFLDQRDGLLVYAPFLLLLFLVFKKEVRARIRDLPLLSAIFMAYVLAHAYTTVRGGYSPAARPTLFIFWIMAIFAAAFAQHAGSGIRRTMTRLLAGLTIFATVWLFYYPLFLYQPVTREVGQRASGLLSFMGSEAVDLAAFFPSFLKRSNSAYLPNWIWLGALALALVIYYAAAAKKKIVKTARFLYPAAGTALLVMVCFFPHVQLRTRYAAAGLSFFCNSRNFSYHQEASAFRFLAGRDYDLFFDLKGSAADRLDLRLMNDERVTLLAKSGTHTLLSENRTLENRLVLKLSALKTFRLNERNLVHLGLESKPGNGNAFIWLKFR